MEKYGIAGQATDGIMAHAHFTLGTSCYKQRLGILNIALPSYMNKSQRHFKCKSPALLLLCVS